MHQFTEPPILAFHFTNERTNNGVLPLTDNGLLTEAAQIHSPHNTNWVPRNPLLDKYQDQNMIPAAII